MAMTAKVVKSDKSKHGKLVIEIDLQEPKPSKSGKTHVVASTHGNKATEAEVNGLPVTIGLNAYIHPEE